MICAAVNDSIRQKGTYFRSENIHFRLGAQFARITINSWYWIKFAKTYFGTGTLQCCIAAHLPVACGRFRLVFRDCGGHGAANKHRSTGQTAIECRTHQHPAWQRLAVSFCSCVICLPVDSNVPS